MIEKRKVEKGRQRMLVKQDKEDEKHFTVRPHKIVYGVGIFIMCMSLLLFIVEILYHVDEIPWWIYLIILGIFLSGVYVFLEAKKRKLIVADNRLHYRSTLGKVKKFELEDIGCVKAAANASGGRDYLRLYNKQGKIICKLECCMQKADYLLSYLYDNKIAIELEKKSGKRMADIIMQQPVSEEEMVKISEKLYEAADRLIKDWKTQNAELGAGFYYGYAQYHGPQMDVREKMQRLEMLYETDGRELPEDYLCVFEIYLQKDDCFVRDRKGNLQMMEFPVFCKRKTGAVNETSRIYYNRNCLKDMENAFYTLGNYLSRHKFIKEQMRLGYELKKSLKEGGA